MPPKPCPRCGATTATREGVRQTTVGCPKCGLTMTLPHAPPPAALAPAKPPKLRTRYATGKVVSGTVVGLEKAAEQHIEGGAFLAGSQVLAGHYLGGHGPMTPDGRLFPAAGHLGGSGAVFGSASIRTRYVYETRFFLRGDDGVDRPVCVRGVDYVPVLEGHRVTAVLCKNDEGEVLLLALVNHNASPRVTPTATEQDILRHLEVPATRRVRRSAGSTLTHARRRGQWRRVRDRFGLATAVVGLTLAIICVVGLYQAETHASVPAFVLAILSGSGAVMMGVAFVYIYVASETRRSGPRYETVTVPNEEADDELDRIEDFVARVADR